MSIENLRYLVTALLVGVAGCSEPGTHEETDAGTSIGGDVNQDGGAPAACGALGEVCCDESACNSGLTCSEGNCAQGSSGTPDAGPRDGSVVIDSGHEEDSGSATADAGGTADSGSDSGLACVYPPGPYGIEQGDVLDPTMEWPGYAAGASTASTVHITDFFDCNGSKGINAVVLDQSAQWCDICQGEATDWPGWMSGGLSADGVQVLTLLDQDTDANSATTTTAQQWITQFSLTMINVSADPNDPFGIASASWFTGYPSNLLIDPRTMVILNASLDMTDGTGNPDPAIATLAKKNKL